MDTTPKNTGKGIIVLRLITGLISGIAIISMGILGIIYLMTPGNIRNPTNTHFHFRMDVIVDGKPVNFAEDKYQTDYRTDICNAALTKQPIHFHDHDKQFVHIHWGSITGGQVLKDYGWNFLGGLQDTLGWRFDKGSLLTRLAIHGNNLPERILGDNYYIYVGDSNGYKERNWNNFLHDPLPTFFQSSVNTPATSSNQSKDEEKLAELNHVIGSTVIFVQKDRPTDTQVKDRFNHLEPLPLSQCAG